MSKLQACDLFGALLLTASLGLKQDGAWHVTEFESFAACL